MVRFLETDSETRLIAKPQLRGAEGQKITLNLGDEIPVPATVFTPVAQGGANFNPLTSFNYRPVGVNIEVTPRVTFEGDIILDLIVENSTLGQDVNIAGQNLPSFGSRKVQTRLRLRDGESNLLAGLLREEERRSLRGIPGLLRLPVLRSLFASNDTEIRQTDIVMLLTPRIVRTQELTFQDVSPIFIGSQQSLGLGGPPPLIVGQPAPGVPDVPAPLVPVAPTPVVPIPGAPNVGQPGAPGPGGVPWCRPAARRFPARRPFPAAPAPARGRGADRSGAGRIPGAPAGGAPPALSRLRPAEDRLSCRRQDRVPRGRRSVHRAGLDHRRVAGLERDADDHVQPVGAAGARRPGRKLHAHGRRRRHVHPAGGRCRRAASTSPSCEPAIRRAWRAPGCSPPCCSTPSAAARPISRSRARRPAPRGTPVPLQFGTRNAGRWCK